MNEDDSVDLVSSNNMKLIVASNRLPFVLSKDDDGEVRVRASSGGLVSVLGPMLKSCSGTWLGWPGLSEEWEKDSAGPLLEASKEAGYTLKGVFLSEDQLRDFYYGFSNEIIWPLFHDLQSLCNFVPEYWRSFWEANRRFVSAIIDSCTDGSVVWVHDYQLMGVAREMRHVGVFPRMGFFLHIPFPSPEIYFKLPWRDRLLRALLDYDYVGFQTKRDMNHFLWCVRRLLHGVKVVSDRDTAVIEHEGRSVGVGYFPVGVDYDRLVRCAAEVDSQREGLRLTADMKDRDVILGIDRLDYTKGIPNRLEAFRNLLRRYPDARDKVMFIQIVVPSRVDIPQYQSLKREIERLVSEINGEFTEPGGIVPIQYIYRSLSQDELHGFYRAAHIALITPLKDGMNVVAKEYCACSLEEDCVLILSEFAGAADRLRHGALLVNPYDIEGVADALYFAYKMPVADRKKRMKRLRAIVKKEDVYAWADRYLRAAFGHGLNDFRIESTVQVAR